MKRLFWLLAVAILGLTACAWKTIHGLTPVHPKARLTFWNMEPRTVGSLRPTFRWEPVTEPDARYDFIIYESHKIRVSWAEPSRTSSMRCSAEAGLPARALVLRALGDSTPPFLSPGHTAIARDVS